MKILVLSDSHSALQFMRQCVESVKPDAIIHLGDFFDDGVVIHEEIRIFHFIRCRETATGFAARRGSRRRWCSLCLA